MPLSRLFHRFRALTPDRLIDESRVLGQMIHPHAAARDDLASLGDYRLGIDGRNRWDVWRSLVRADHASVEQLDVLVQCRRKVASADELRIQGNTLSCFLACFDKLGKHGSLATLTKSIDDRTTSWEELQTQIREAKPRVFVSHAFLMLSDISGVETVSLFIGGLIALGAVHMKAFYDGAVGETVAAYWTLDDLIVQGILVLEQVAVSLLLIEVVFYCIHRLTLILNGESKSYVAHWWILRHPFIVILPSVAIMVLVACVWGYTAGEKARNEFLDLTSLPEEEDASEEKLRKAPRLATMTDGTILQDVFLVGTTSRTATLLQVTQWGTRSPDEDRKCTKPKEDLTLPEVDRPSPDAEPNQGRIECVRRHRVLVVDRAHVVCIATGKACLDQARIHERPPLDKESNGGDQLHADPRT